MKENTEANGDLDNGQRQRQNGRMKKSKAKQPKKPEPKEPKWRQSPAAVERRYGLLPRQEIVEQIISRLSEGEPLRQICRDEGMPHWSAIYQWMNQDRELAVAVAHAREIGYDAIAEDCFRIADNPVIGEETTVRADGSTETRTGDMLGHRKLQIETRLKLLACFCPKRYGDKPGAVVNVGAGAGATNNVIQMTSEDIADLQARRRAALLKMQERRANGLPAIELP